jgi:hypothetical protein
MIFGFTNKYVEKNGAILFSMMMTLASSRKSSPS